MQCANPQCSAELLYLRDGSLQLFQFEPDAEHSHDGGDDGAFPMRSSPCRFFWLCARCSRLYVMKRWTSSGVVLCQRNPGSMIGIDSESMKRRKTQAA